MEDYKKNLAEQYPDLYGGKRKDIDKNTSLNTSHREQSQHQFKKNMTSLIESKERKLRRMKYFLSGSIYFISLYTIFLLFNNIIIPSIVHNREMVVVPKTIGLSLEQAKERLLLKGLEYEVVGEIYKEGVKPGTVIKQNPNPGANVKVKRPVYLSIARGLVKLEVPNLLGLTYRNAKIRLENQNLLIGRVDSANSNDFAKFTIMAQSPGVGYSIESSRYVNITISIGSSEKVVVPNIVGHNLEGIFEFLKENGLDLGNVLYEKNELFNNNTIIKQSPIAGDSVQRGAFINIVVAN